MNLAVMRRGVGLALVLGGPMLHGGQWDLSGSLALESRWFPEDPSWVGQKDDPGASFVLEPEAYWESGDGTWAFLAHGFLRGDSLDDRRSHADLRELFLQWRGAEWEWKVGAAKIFWGVTESRHLVDLINQTDTVEGTDGEDKLGQPMVQLTRLLSWGNVDFLVLPYFRERRYPGEAGRWRGPWPVAVGRSRYESGAEEWNPDVALRLKGYVGAFDLGLSLFHGTSREPLLELDATGRAPVMVPVYNLIDQVGLDLQYTHEAWLWKLEAIARSGEGQHYRAASGGFEYTFYGVGGTPWDLGALLEFHYDSRGSTSPDPFNHDVFAGFRLALNDEEDTSLLVGVVRDLEWNSLTGRIEFERRLANGWVLAVEGQWFGAVDARDPLASVQRDGFVQMELRAYF